MVRNRFWQLAPILGLLLLLVIIGAACGPAGTDPVESDVSEASDDGPTVMEEPASIDTSEKKTTAGGNGLEIDPEAMEMDHLGLTVGFTKDGHAFRGDPSAPVVIEEYSDFQCPFCTRFHEQTLPSLVANQLKDGEAVLVYYDFPLNSIHPQAAPAANAARCAGEQGAAAFWAMHDALFENADAWSNQNATAVFGELASDIGLELDTFNECVDSDRYGEQVRADLSAGTNLGVSGTPTFFLNGQMLVGAQPVAAFNDAIEVVNRGGQLASNQPQQNEPAQPAVAPTPASFTEDFAGAMGNPGAPVTIVEFTDYQCPFCARHSLETMPQIVQEMVEAGRVYYILKDFPLDQLHPQARAAATAARCAGEQDAYWEMHDAIFSNQSDWAEQSTEAANELFGSYANELDLDEDVYASCLVSGRYDEAIETNLQEGQTLGVSGTPFFFVEGYPLNGARPIEHFQIAVELAEEGRLAEAFTPQEQQQPQQPQQPSGPVEVPIDNSHSIGEPDAPVVIVEYTDFQCPFCSRHFQQTFPAIVEQYVNTGLVRYVFKDFPLNSIHPQAAKAAEAARCAGDQEQYVEMHDLLFANQQEWSGKDPINIFVGYAEQLGLDSDSFSECLTSGQYEAAVNGDLQEGIGFGVTGTPAFFLNGYPLSGAQPLSVFQQAIESLLAEAEGTEQ